jgi:hypothetical protein
MDKELDVLGTLLRTIVKNDLKLKLYTKQKVHGLTEAEKVARAQNCRQLLAWHAGDKIIFLDKKQFLLQKTHNQQNKRI